MTLDVQRFNDSRFITELDVVSYTGDRAVLGPREVAEINHSLYGRSMDLAPVIKAGGRYICADTDSAVPSETLAIPQDMAESYDGKLPAHDETVYIVTGEIAQSFFGM